jgi:hypothetical protein
MVTPPEPTSVFRGTLTFFDKLGVYDVVLPFLLIFTIVFAILEKTRIFGTDKVEGKDITRKNLNGMTAFVTAFFVVASTKLVAVVNEVMANTVLLLLLSVCFLLLAGSFHSGKEEFFLKKPWKNIFMIIMFVGISLIFLNALGWLEPAWDYLIGHWDSTVVGSVLLMGVIIAFMFLIVREPKREGSKS